MKKFILLTLIALAGLGTAWAEGPARRQRLGWAQEARGFYARQEHRAAIDLLEKAAGPGASKKDLLQWYPLLGRCHEALGNYQKALSVYQEAHDLRPKNVDRMLDLARIYAQVDLNQEAIDLYKHILKKEKNRRDVLLALARLYFKAGQLEAAQKEADHYLRLEPRDTSAQFLMVQIEQESGQWPAAAHRWEGILAQEPAPQGYFDLGRLWARQNQYELAEESFKKASGLGMDTAAFHFHRGLLAWRRGDEKAAAEFWNKTLEQDPRLTLASFFLALVDQQKGELSSARRRMNQVQAESASDYVKALAESFLGAAGTPATTSGDKKN